MKNVTKRYITKENLDVSHSSTILSRLLSLIPRHVFTQAEREYPTERKARVFSRWNQFACLSFIHVAARHSMRDGLRLPGTACTPEIPALYRRVHMKSPRTPLLEVK